MADESKKSSSVVGIMDNLTMPAMWDSRDDGLSLEYGDYICILQTEPRGLVEVGLEMGKFPKDMGERDSEAYEGLWHEVSLCFVLLLEERPQSRWL